MTITERKRITALIPEDLVEGEDIEVSDDGENWTKSTFDGWHHRGHPIAQKMPFSYARRPATSADWPNSLKGWPEWPARPIIKGRYIVTEEYCDGAMTQRKVEMPDEGIVMVRP